MRTFEWEGMPGHVLLETGVFEDLGDRTRVTTTLLFDTTEERDGMLAPGMERGRQRDLRAARRAPRPARLELRPGNPGGRHRLPPGRWKRRSARVERP